MNGQPPGPVGRLRARLSSLLGGRGSLTSRVLTSSLWMLGGNLGMKALRLGVNLILVRLLVPEDFGLMALIFTLHAGFDMLTDIGIKPAVVRSEAGDDPRFLRTAWTLQAVKFGTMAVALAAFGALYGLASDWIDVGDTIYAHPELPGLIAASSLILLANGLQSINVATAERQVAMQRVLAVNMSAYVVSSVATVIWAWAAPSVWALMWGTLIGAVLRSALGHLVLPGPRMGFDLDPAHRDEIWAFGKWIMGSSALGFLAQHGDKLVLAALFEPVAFSFYAIARLWIDAAKQLVGRISQTAGLAALAEVNRTRPAELPRALRKYRRVQGAVCVVMFLGFVLVAGPFIAALYPADFAAVGALLPQLAPLLLLQTYSALQSVALMAGRSRALAGVTLWRAVALLAGMPIAHLLLGPAWTICFIAVSGAFGVPALLRLTRTVAPIDLRLEYALLTLIVAIAIAMTLFLGWSPG
jgi:O-antigen/teichoic acid export membrane protein